MKIFFFTILFLICICSFSFSQNDHLPAFSSEMLENPSKYIKEYDQIFGYNEISKFREVSTKCKLVLENGYAAFIIKKPEAWISLKSGKKVKSITIVFTKYPRRNKDWITNYNELLANRLKALFKMDPDLNKKEIKWYLLLQTECKTDKEARIFFHGIVINYESIEKMESKNILVQDNRHNSQNILLLDTVSIFNNDEEIKQNAWFVNEVDFNKSNSFLYRECTPLTKKKKLAKVPGCPDFTKKSFKRFF